MNPQGEGVAAMTFTITDITELVLYHPVLSVPDDETADNKLPRLVHEIEGLATTPLWATGRVGSFYGGQAAERAESAA
jgi:hypothetical protein